MSPVNAPLQRITPPITDMVKFSIVLKKLIAYYSPLYKFSVTVRESVICIEV